MSWGGINVLKSGDRIVFEADLNDDVGALLASGTTSLYVFEVQNDGTLKSYDFNDNTFKTTALTTATQAMTHRTGNNSTFNTGFWSYALTTLTGFAVGGEYMALVTNTNAWPGTFKKHFLFGGADHDQIAVYGTVSDAGAAVGDFDGSSNLSTTADFYNGAVLVFRSGALQGIGRKISDYSTGRNLVFSGSTGAADAPFPAAPANGDAFVIIGRIGT